MFGIFYDKVRVNYEVLFYKNYTLTKEGRFFIKYYLI